MDAKVYDRAANFLPENASRFVLNSSVTPHWRSGGADRFTYRKQLPGGRAVFRQVDARTGRATDAFNHATVAQGLTKALGETVAANDLPFFDFDEIGAAAIRFDAKGKTWTCSTTTPHCEGVAASDLKPTEVRSPDGKWVAYIEDYNLWVRSSDGATRRRLTSDGEAHDAYGRSTELSIGAVSADGGDHAMVDAEGHHIGLQSRAVLAWSPDSRRILTDRLDERKVREISVVQWVPPDGSPRPVTTTWRMAMPNDPDLPMAQSWVIDVDSGLARKVALDPAPTDFFTAIEAKDAWWSQDGGRIFEIVRSRYHKSMTLYAVDPASGSARPLISETGKTFVESAGLGERPMVYVLKSGDIIWFSERDGWGSLYLYDAAGRLKRRLTGPGWTVRNVLRLDEAKGLVYVAGNEREPASDPYFKSVYAVGLNDGRVTRLTPEDADHNVASAQQDAENDTPTPMARDPDESRGFSPSGRYFIDTLSRPDQPSRTVLRTVEGRLVAEIETADLTALKAIGYHAPERFSALAADGKTMLYGDILRPKDFDPSRRYPVLDSPYPGPQANRAPISLEHTVFDRGAAQAFAELGFVVVLVDGRGTSGRSKAFHDESYGGLSQAGHLDDHVAVIKELARRYPYMDVDRVGIYGTSGGGYAAARAMFAYPDFFKVGVSDAGNHEQKSYIAVWGEVYNGPDDGKNYAAASNAAIAKNLKGKLFLLHGDMDINVSPTMTSQVVDALIKANKDFDLLIVPNAGHGTILRKGYALRRAWDFMVRNLMNLEPPLDYDISKTAVADRR